MLLATQNKALVNVPSGLGRFQRPTILALAVMNRSSQKLKMGFRLGIYTKEEVIDWVVAEIDQSDEPSDKLLDLSFATTKGVHDIYSALCDLDGSPEEDDVLIEVLTDLEDQVIENIEFCRDLAIKLYSYYIDKSYEVDQRLTEIGYFDDGYDLALRGIGETIDEWHTRFKGFLNELKNC